jgi:hypothetical protein
MVGGGYAMKRHTGRGRAPRDLDVFMTPEDGRRALKHFEGSATGPSHVSALAR